jgi:uncharacterized DUF497 family protein
MFRAWRRWHGVSFAEAIPAIEDPNAYTFDASTQGSARRATRRERDRYRG